MTPASLDGGRAPLELAPVFLTDALKYVAKHHRHCIPPVSGLFAVAVRRDGEIAGVAIAGRPTGRGLQDGYTVEITRNTTDGAPNACSMLLGACRRAAVALGYRRVYTYTLQSEPGSSVRAAGFVLDCALPARETWDTPSRRRVQTDLFGQERRPSEAKTRWVWPASAVQGAAQ